MATEDNRVLRAVEQAGTQLANDSHQDAESGFRSEEICGGVDIEKSQPRRRRRGGAFPYGWPGFDEIFQRPETSQWISEEDETVLPARIASCNPDNLVGKAPYYFGLDVPGAFSGPPVEGEEEP